jgi:hypothetical protein
MLAFMLIHIQYIDIKPEELACGFGSVYVSNFPRVLWDSVFQPVVRVPPGIRGRFRRGTSREIKYLKLWLLHQFVSLSHFNLFIVSIRNVGLPFIIKFVCHTIITR